MQAQSARKIKTFSIGFHESGFDEAGHARGVAGHLGCDHTELYVGPREALNVIPALGDMFDEPFADPSQIPTHLVSQMARTDVTVALSGDGGDEVFAGYNHYRRGEMLWRWMSRVPYRLRLFGASIGRGMLAERYGRLLAAMPRACGPAQISDKIAKARQALSCEQPDDLYRHIASKWRDPSTLAIRACEASRTPCDPGIAFDIPGFAERMQFYDSVSYLPDDILTTLDRTTMQVGLEARVPLLDHRVVEFAWRQPLRRKFRDGNGKWLLRQILHRYVPAELVDRPKSGFNVPIGSWLRGPLREWAEDLLDPRQIASDGLLRADNITRMWREHLSGLRDWRYPLWVVLMLQQWNRGRCSHTAAPNGASLIPGTLA